MDTAALAQALQAWVEEVLRACFPAATWQGLAIDGKTLRRSTDEYVQQEFPWSRVGQVFQVQRRCLNLSTGEVTTTLHYAITSLRVHQAAPALLFRLRHQHWNVESKGHWVLDDVRICSVLDG